MATSLEKIKGAALALPDDERQSLIVSLAHSFGDPEPISDEELHLRFQQIESGAEEGIPHEDVIAGARSLIV